MNHQQQASHEDANMFRQPRTKRAKSAARCCLLRRAHQSLPTARNCNPVFAAMASPKAAAAAVAASAAAAQRASSRDCSSPASGGCPESSRTVHPFIRLMALMSSTVSVLLR